MFNKLFAVFTALLVTWATLLLLSVYSGMIFADIWNWFIASHFDIQTLTTVQGVGVMIVAAYPLIGLAYSLEIIKGAVDQDTKEGGAAVAVATAFGMFVAINFVWAWAWFIHHFFY
jgi:hypothetical protein